jgi:hypothetical protein
LPSDGGGATKQEKKIASLSAVLETKSKTGITD